MNPLKRSAWLTMTALLAHMPGNAAAQDIDPESGNAQPFPGTPLGPYVLAWSDEFNSTALNTTKWDYRTDSKHWSTQLPANVTLSSGTLRLNLKKENAGGMAYTGAGVISKTARRYGYYEARMKTPPGAGWHSSFWMMKHDGSGGTGTSQTAIELDVIENDSISPLDYGVNAHRWNPGPHVTYGSRTITTPALSAGYHVFGCEFTATTVKYFFDGVLVQTVAATQFPHGDVHVWLTSIASFLGGTTAVDDTQLPASVDFDYARFFTPLATSAVAIVSPGRGGSTLSDTETRLRVTAQATTSDVNFPPTVLWTKVSGPGVVTFANAASADTSAQFSAPGSYVLQCEATVGVSVNAAQVPVAVNAPLTVTLRQGENGYSHLATFIRGDSVNWNSGARDQFLVGRFGNQRLRPLFSFDLSLLDSAAVIQSASLDLWTNASPGVATVGAVELRSLNATPIEGTGDGSSAGNGAGTGATWVSRTGSVPWTTAGGDFGATVLSSVPGYDATVTLAQKLFASSADFVAAAQSAVSTATPLNLIALSPTTEAGASNAFSRLISDDGGPVSARPRLTVTFLGNVAPALSASISPVITRGLPGALGGSVSAATSSGWSSLSGPGTVTFTNATVPGTTAVFSQPGSYLLQLAASNTHGQTSRTFSVNVLSRLDTWRLTHFGSTANTGLAADLTDSDGDGEVNLLEFATHQDPNTNAPSDISFMRNGATLELTYTRSLAAMADGVTFTVEWSDTLANDWSSAGVSEQLLSTNGTVQTVRASIAVGAGGRRFLHLKVSKP